MNINFRGEILSIIFLTTREKKQGYPLSSLPVDIVLEVLTSAIRQEKETGDIQIGNEEGKLSLFDMA